MNNQSIREQYEALIGDKIKEASKLKVTDDKYPEVMKSIAEAYKVTNDEDKIMFDGQNKIDDRDLELKRVDTEAIKADLESRRIDLEEIRIELDKLSGQRDFYKFNISQGVSLILGLGSMVVVSVQMGKDRNFGLDNIKTSPVSRMSEGLLGRLFKTGK